MNDVTKGLLKGQQPDWPFIGAQLRERRQRAGLTLAALSERCGIDKGTLSRAERGIELNPAKVALIRSAIGKAKA